MKSLCFEKNYNGKLDCDFFITFQPVEKYKKNEKVDIRCKGREAERGKVVSVTSVALKDITEVEAFLDSGLPVKKFRSLLAALIFPTAFTVGEGAVVDRLLISKEA